MGNQKRIEKKNFLRGKMNNIRNGNSSYKKEGKTAKGCISAIGKIIKNEGAGFFSVILDNNVEIKATLSGALRLHNIRILPGDKVKLDLSVYDLTQGRITRRL